MNERYVIYDPPPDETTRFVDNPPYCPFCGKEK